MTSTDSALAEALRLLGDVSFADQVTLDAPLGALTTYRVGGTAAALVELSSKAEAVELSSIVSTTGVSTLVVGRGSNLLVADAGFAGVAVVLGDEFAGVETTDSRVVAGGSAKLPVVARVSVDAGLAGFEWAVGVPGSIGGAVRMNAGGHGAEISDSLVSATIVDLSAGGEAEVSRADLKLGYRSSSVGPSQIVVAATLHLEPGDVDEGRQRLAEIVQWRRANQPGGQNAGSVFTNPSGDSAGRLIDLAGAKGLRLRSAEVSGKHANFIQSDEDGSADDIFELMQRVRRMVADAHGIDLLVETRLVGFETHGPSGS